jgi:isoleucyl-tRNA synthetase
VAQGYKTVKDRSVYIKFQVAADSKVAKKGDYILSWTTTPWTLPGNVALAVGEKIDYVRLKIGNEYFILAENLIGKIFGDTAVDGSQKFQGKDLVGTKYEPLFPGVITTEDKDAFEVVPASFVSTTDGTGVVHTAVMYGVDDFDLGLQFNLPQVHTVDLAGKFLPTVEGFAGMFVKGKTTEDKLIAYLQEHNILLKEELYEHEYPFCWRCGTPLLYYAKTSWFIAMSKVQAQLVKNAETINWYPSHIKSGRFGEWLNGIKDWAISRKTTVGMRCCSSH